MVYGKSAIIDMKKEESFQRTKEIAIQYGKREWQLRPDVTERPD